MTAFGHEVDIGTFPRMQAPVFVSLAVDGPENAVEILANANGRRLRY